MIATLITATVGYVLGSLTVLVGFIIAILWGPRIPLQYNKKISIIVLVINITIAVATLLILIAALFIYS